MPFAVSAGALCNFASTVETNPGRLNLLHGAPFTALVDWVGGPEAATELASVARNLPVASRRLLVLTAVGNRSDDFIMAAAGRLAGHFEHYICSNHIDLRGRAADDVPTLLRTGLMRSGVAAADIQCIADPGQALDQAMAVAGADDLLVVASYSTEFVLRRIMSRQA